MRTLTCANSRNWYLDANLNRVSVSHVQQINDCTYYRRGNTWVDARLIDRVATAKPVKTIEIGSDELRQLVERLTREGRPGVVSLKGDILLEVDGQPILIKDRGKRWTVRQSNEVMPKLELGHEEEAMKPMSLLLSYVLGACIGVSADVGAESPSILPQGDSGTAGVNPAAHPSTPSADLQLQAAVEQLGSSNFRRREEATRELAGAGLAAVPYVEAASRSKNAETRNRAARILSGWLRATEPRLAAAAEQALGNAARERTQLAVTAQRHLSANQLRREAEFVADLDRRVPLKNLLLL